MKIIFQIFKRQWTNKYILHNHCTSPHLHAYKRLHVHYICIKFVTKVEGDPKAPFSIATTPTHRVVQLISMDCATLPLIPTL